MEKNTPSVEGDSSVDSTKVVWNHAPGYTPGRAVRPGAVVRQRIWTKKDKKTRNQEETVEKSDEQARP